MKQPSATVSLVISKGKRALFVVPMLGLLTFGIMSGVASAATPMTVVPSVASSTASPSTDPNNAPLLTPERIMQIKSQPAARTTTMSPNTTATTTYFWNWYTCTWKYNGVPQSGTAMLYAEYATDGTTTTPYAVKAANSTRLFIKWYAHEVTSGYIYGPSWSGLLPATTGFGPTRIYGDPGDIDTYITMGVYNGSWSCEASL